ncbi:MAG TPA: hypothetical protein VEM36_13590 [Xanthobacteraceae bacterium]|nr:hypothetical protein [Xanthobacteraceae bacterium]
MLDTVHHAPAFRAAAKEPIFTKWDETTTALWGRQPVCIEHRLHESPLFSRPALAALIESYPREHYNIFSMSAQTENKFYWRQGDFNGHSGEEVLNTIANGRLWLNLRKANAVDRRYGELLDAILAELGERIPGFSSQRHECGILVSSPKAQVYYHVDLGGQLLFQIMGNKRLYFYAPDKPFITGEDLERTSISSAGVDIPYRPWFDEYARVYEDFVPGQMVHWPLFAPHRVENYDCLNVSMTMEFTTPMMMRTQVINLANGALRARFGYEPRSRAISGPAFWAKTAMWAALRKSSWLKQARAHHTKIEFRFDRTAPGGLADVTS